jgi:superfamily II DNA/RNA helicase
VHRIGRTGRAGKEGRAFTIATPEDRFAVDAIEKLVAAPIPRIEIPGLDTVEWAEGDSRRNRGRGAKGKPAPKPASRPARAAEDAPPPRERERERDRERTPRPPRRDEPRREARPEATAEPRREPRTVYATDNLGPAIRGFGADIPAFMLIRKRGPLSAILEEPVDYEEEDFSHTPDGGEDMAA